MMNTDFFKEFSEQAKQSAEPISKFNELMTKSIKDSLKMQMDSAKQYSDLASERLQAFTQVRDFEGMQEFIKGQFEALTTVNEQMLADMQALAEAGQKFRDEAESIFKPEPEVSKTKASSKAKA